MKAIYSIIFSFVSLGSNAHRSGCVFQALTLRRRVTPPQSGSRPCGRARRRTGREWLPEKTCQ